MLFAVFRTLYIVMNMQTYVELAHAYQFTLIYGRGLDWDI